MASLKEHCEDCSRELGEDFKHVHEWLDALFKVLGPKHRSARHHAGGVAEVRKRAMGSHRNILHIYARVRDRVNRK